MTPRPTPADRDWMPPGATDTHVHVFDGRHFPLPSDRTYTPADATVAQLQARHGAWGIGRVVVVQPSVYGRDNGCLLAAIATLGTQCAVGIAVVDARSITDAELQRLHDAGVRGVRLNFKTAGRVDEAGVAAELQRVAALIRQPGWCVQLHGPASTLGCVARQIDRFHVPVVLDHFAGLGAAEGLQTLRALLETGRVWVKLSAPYRVSAQAPDFADLRPVAEALIEAYPARLLWGSDWPHTGGDGVRSGDLNRIEPFRQVDIPAALRALRQWAGDDRRLRAILVDNPAALYGFAHS